MDSQCAELDTEMQKCLQDLQSTVEGIAFWRETSMSDKLEEISAILKFREADICRQLEEVKARKAENARQMDDLEYAMSMHHDIEGKVNEITRPRVIEQYFTELQKALEATSPKMENKKEELKKEEQQLKSHKTELHEKLHKLFQVEIQFEDQKVKFLRLNNQNPLEKVKAYKDILNLFEQNQLTLNDKDKEIRDIREQLEMSQSMAQSLITSQRLANDLIQDARKTLLDELSSVPPSDGHMIYIKRMGELDTAAFCAGVEKQPIVGGEAKGNSPVILCSLWQSHIEDISWHPFKVVTENGKSIKAVNNPMLAVLPLLNVHEIIDEDDQKLMSLKNDLGMEAYRVVTTALKELNQYKPSGRYPVNCIWNRREGRETSINEAIIFLLEQQKPKRRRSRRL